MTDTDKIIVVLLMFCLVVILAAYLTKKRGGLFVIDYSDPFDESSNRYEERKRGRWFINVAFRITKYLIGILLLFISLPIIKVVGALILAGSFLYDRYEEES